VSAPAVSAPLTQIPNALTILRLALIPLFVALLIPADGGQSWPAAIVFALAGVTDQVDGWLARRLNQTSAFGAFLDPVADKLMVAAALIILVQLERVDAIIALIIIGREVAISALREWMAGIGAARSVAVSFLGKVKTASQMLAIPLLLYHDPLGAFRPQQVGTWLIVLAAVLTLVSMAYYLKVALPQLWRAQR